ncbi:uncharacterized protein LOC142627616 [Castanea sativa]|uniref:uncharacterized protein LOC142627616 n=1 Tax=Castanea sativa TaxID=21020 RepID=UPI003AE8226A
MEEETIMQTDITATDKTVTVMLDIESLAQSSDRGSGSPKVTRALSRKWSHRADRWTNNEEEDIDESSKKFQVKVNSQFEPLKQPLMANKALIPTPTVSGPNLIDAPDGRNKKLNRFMSINPRKILLIFATVSSMGTLILIYFTLAINKTV